MTAPASLAKLDQATRMLAEIHTIDDATQLISLAEAARVYARQVKLGLEAQNHASEIKARAQRKAGEILDSIDGQPGARTDLPTSLPDETRLKQDVYDDVGITRKTANVWQMIAKLPEEVLTQYIIEVKEDERELTTSGLLKFTKQFLAGEKEEAPELPDGKYRIIYADPPWKYSDTLVDGYGPAEFHYPPMTTTELCELPIKELADDNAVLFLWVTSPLLEDSFKIIKAWGFEYKSSFVWDKIKHNYGHYNSVRHEFLLVCTKGSCTPDVPQLFDSVQSIERTDRHSEKPEEFRTIIDTLYTRGRRIELFAREQVEGWEAWGNERLTVSA